MKKIILALSVIATIFNINNSFANEINLNRPNKISSFEFNGKTIKNKVSINGYLSSIPNAGVSIARQYDFNDYFSAEAGLNVSMLSFFPFLLLNESRQSKPFSMKEYSIMYGTSILIGVYGSFDYTFGTNKSNFRKYTGVHLSPLLPGIHVGSDYYFNKKHYINLNLSADAWMYAPSAFIPVASVSYGFKF